VVEIASAEKEPQALTVLTPPVSVVLLELLLFGEEKLKIEMKILYLIVKKITTDQ